MSSQETVACPSCGETATYNVGDKDITLAQCKNHQCRKSFKIYMRQGKLSEVKIW